MNKDIKLQLRSISQSCHLHQFSIMASQQDSCHRVDIRSMSASSECIDLLQDSGFASPLSPCESDSQSDSYASAADSTVSSSSSTDYMTRVKEAMAKKAVAQLKLSQLDKRYQLERQQR